MFTGNAASGGPATARHTEESRTAAPPIPQNLPQFAGHKVKLPVPRRHSSASIAPEVRQQPFPDPDFQDPQLPVNWVSPDFVPRIKRMPQPDSHPLLQDDKWLVWLGTEPGTGLAPGTPDAVDPLVYIRALLRERKEVEAAKGEFLLPPLLTTLENMQAFIRHIREGRQFPEPLDAEESVALARIEEQTNAFVEAQTPWYKRTICLALSLMILCELITQRQILRPLRCNRPPALFRYISMALDDCKANKTQLLAALPWIPPAPDGTSGQGLPAAALGRVLHSLFFEAIHDDSRLIYPSFQPLTLGHFCHFGGFPLYPVGLTTDYACPADGFVHSPLQFAEHDLEHMRELETVGKPGARTAVAAVLRCYEKRQALRQLLLDRRPESLEGLQLNPALVLLLFNLLHEQEPDALGRVMGWSCSRFFFLLKTLSEARREHWTSYTAEDLQGTESEAAMAALWTSSVWKLWETAGYQLSDKQLQDHARHFVTRDVPRLQQHLAFAQEHRAALRRLFAQNAVSYDIFDNNEHCFIIETPDLNRLTLFRSYYERSGLRHLDNTDLAYFAALYSPVQRRQMEQVTQAFLPEGTGDRKSLS